MGTKYIRELGSFHRVSRRVYPNGRDYFNKFLNSLFQDLKKISNMFLWPILIRPSVSNLDTDWVFFV
jgi:hypothetical protein